MDLSGSIQYVVSHVTPFNVLILVLLIASEVLGAKENIKASSLYGLFRTLLVTFKDQAWPQPVLSAPAPVKAPAPLPAEPVAQVTPNNPQ